jgi:hypothetical protein
MKNRDKKEVKTECIKCWKKVKVTFNPSVKRINCLEVECCKLKERRSKCKIKAEMRHLYESKHGQSGRG